MNEEEAREYIEQFIGIKKEYKCKPIKVKTLNNTRVAIETVLNLLEKKDRQLEERTNRIRNLEKECQSNFDNMMDTIQDNSKKDKMIEYMANFINDNTPYTKDTRILENERGVRNTKYTEQYFENKVTDTNVGERKVENGN